MYSKSHFLMILSFFSSLVTFSPAEGFMDNFKGIWGVGGSILQTNYAYSDNKTTLSPYIFGNVGDLRIEANRILYPLYVAHAYSILATGNYRSQQYSEELNLDRSIEFGLTLQIPLSYGVVSRLAVLGDVSNTHNGYELEAQLYRHDSIGQLSILTALSAQYQDAKLANYYYATQTYNADDGFVFEAEMIVAYPIRDFSVFAGVRSYWYGSNVTDSPLTTSSNTFLSFFGVGYNF